MLNIYINTLNNEITFRDGKNRLVKQYSNLSTQKSNELLSSIKLLMISLNKIFNMNNRYYDEVYMFYITNNELLDYIKADEFNIRTHIKRDWKNELDNKTLSELGNLLNIFKKIDSKDIVFWDMENDERYALRVERERLNERQSKIDSQIQDILHDIQNLKDDEITESKALSFIMNIRHLRKERNKIKTNIKNIEQKERTLVYEKNKL